MGSHDRLIREEPQLHRLCKDAYPRMRGLSIVSILKFDEKTLVSDLRQLPRWARLTFAASVASRMSHAYTAYINAGGKGDPTLITATLEFVWRNILAAADHHDQIRGYLESIMQLIPPEDVTVNSLNAYAEDALSSSAYTLRTCLSGEPQEAAWAARCTYEAVDEYVIELIKIPPGSHEAETSILAHPLMQQELNRQKRDVSDLQTYAASDPEVVISSFRDRSMREHALSL